MQASILNLSITDRYQSEIKFPIFSSQGEAKFPWLHSDKSNFHKLNYLLNQTHLTDIFQNNEDKLVPEYHHSGFHYSNDDGGGCDNWSYKTCKAPVKSSPAPPTHQHLTFSQARCPSCHPTNSVSTEDRQYHIPWSCSPQLTWGRPSMSWSLKAPGYLGEGYQTSRHPSDSSTPYWTKEMAQILKLWDYTIFQ